MNFQVPSRRSQIAIGAGTLAVLATIYLLSFQNDICGHPNRYVIDSGEYQIALALWGTVHHTGAPAYSWVGALFVWLLRLLGVQPAAGAALFSVACALAALGLIYSLGLRLGGNPLASGAATLALGLGRSFWINSVVAEIYAFGLMLSAASLWLALRYNETRADKTLYALAFVWGQAIVHHRLAVFMAPALAVLVLPGLCHPKGIDLGRERWLHALRAIAISICLGALAFTTYLYMPLRARMGAWTYGDPGTWEGFWFIFWAREVPFLLVPPASLTAWLANVRATFAQLVVEWSLPGLAAAGVGAIVAVAQPNLQRTGTENTSALRLTKGKTDTAFGIALSVMLASYLAFVFTFHVAVSPEEALLWVSLCLALTLAVLVARLGQWKTWLGAAGVAGLIVLGGVSGLSNCGTVLELTHSTRGRELIKLLEARMPKGGEVEPTFMALWSGDYFAAIYGSRVSGELDGFDVVDHRAYFKQIVESGSRLITQPATFHELPKSWWRKQIGGAHLSSAELGLVEIAPSPPLTPADVPPGDPVALGDGISLRAYQVEALDSAPFPNGLHVTLYWQATYTPTQRYSVMVHISDRERIAAPEDLIAQADSQAPVYGWYPTDKWGPGEIVREDYRLVVPPGKTPRLLAVGMYTRDEAGAFHNLGVVDIALEQK